MKRNDAERLKLIIRKLDTCGRDKELVRQALALVENLTKKEPKDDNV